MSITLLNRNVCKYFVGTCAHLGAERTFMRSIAAVSGRPLSTATEKRKKSGLYTKTGDSGNSSLFNGERRPKADIVFDVLGHQDELNAVIGIAREHCTLNENGLQDMLREIQSRLFDLGAAVATPVQTSSSRKKAYTEFHPIHTAILEEWIDRIDSTLPPIVNFVIPSGGMSSTHLNHARAICRRAERSVYSLIQNESCDAEVGRYLNRLSDFLFAATRAAAMREGREELLWIKAVLPSSEASAVSTAASVVAKDSFDAASRVGAGSASASVSGKNVETHQKSATNTHNLNADVEGESEGESGHKVEPFGGMDDEFFDPTGTSTGVPTPGGDGPIISRSAASRSNLVRTVRVGVRDEISGAPKVVKIIKEGPDFEKVRR